MEEKTIQMPVSKLSYSALTQLLRNPIMFKFKYVLSVYDGLVGVSGMVGRACHEALKVYYGGGPDDILVPPDHDEAIGIAREYGLQYLVDFPDAGINFGKTGSREEMLKKYAQAMDFYFAEEPVYHEIVACEEKMDAVLVTTDGQELPLPAVCVPDLVVKNEDETYDIIDTKFVSSFTDAESEDYIKIIQAKFLDHVVRGHKKVRAKNVIFREIKISENSKENKGKPQIQDYIIPLDHGSYDMIFFNLYKDVVKFLSNPDAIYLPNLSDPFDGEQAGLIYSQGLISSDMSDVQVMHKVRDVAMVSKKFVTSRLDNVENEHLLPEERIRVRLAEFGIPVVPQPTLVGTSVTQYRFKVSAGVRMSSVKKHKDDIALALQIKGEVRILAPIPGTSLIGVEIENEKRGVAKLTKKHLKPHTLSIPIGLNVDGDTIYSDLADMPHLLVGGTTGSGKSRFLCTLIKVLCSQLYPEELKLVLFDPKRVEFSEFKNFHHLQGGIIYEYEDGVRRLMKLVDEMDKRYEILNDANVHDIKSYNKKSKEKMPYIVVVIDELADYLMRSQLEESKKKSAGYSAYNKSELFRLAKRRDLSVSDKISKGALVDVLEQYDEKDEMNRADADVEHLIVRLAQLGRACGIHLVVATQHPIVKVITGMIKANISTRIAFMVTSKVNSQIILDQSGAENLVGKGDMLFLDPKVKGLQRLQGLLS